MLIPGIAGAFAFFYAVIAMKTIWFAVPIASILALSVLAFQEAKLTDTVWWGCMLPALFVLALWKYRVLSWIGSNSNSNMSQDEYNTARRLAFWWLGLYFFLVGGFFVAIITSQFYDFKIPNAAFLGFLSLWWTKFELWGLLVCRNCDGSRGHLNS